MSDPKEFLSRWSQRKLAGEPKTSTADDKAVPKETGEATAPEIDLSKLPSLESIGANSDITAFLQRGVPASLTRAALRRAWSADPAIRDFVGLSENSWDFNTPNSMPGFGPLESANVQKIAAQFFGEVEKPAKTQLAALEKSPEAEQQGQTARRNDSEADAAKPAEKYVALQHDESEAKPVSASPLRRHGGALPE